jgi:alkaline phosphatase D
VSYLSYPPRERTCGKMLQILVFVTLIGVSFASYGANLNYRSPSLHHPGLGISVRKVVKRHVERQATPASQLNFTHGVASGDPFPNSVILWTRCAPVSAPSAMYLLGSSQFHLVLDC